MEQLDTNGTLLQSLDTSGKLLLHNVLQELSASSRCPEVAARHNAIEFL
ncbi:MAG TPA: hypothetical protein VGJ21_01990 [Terracidiphilus sp.]